MAGHTHATCLNIVGDPESLHANVVEVETQTLVFRDIDPNLTERIIKAACPAAGL